MWDYVFAFQCRKNAKCCLWKAYESLRWLGVQDFTKKFDIDLQMLMYVHVVKCFKNMPKLPRSLVTSWPCLRALETSQGSPKTAQTQAALALTVRRRRGALAEKSIYAIGGCWRMRMILLQVLTDSWTWLSEVGVSWRMMQLFAGSWTCFDFQKKLCATFDAAKLRSDLDFDERTPRMNGNIKWWEWIEGQATIHRAQDVDRTNTTAKW